LFRSGRTGQDRWSRRCSTGACGSAAAIRHGGWKGDDDDDCSTSGGCESGGGGHRLGRSRHGGFRRRSLVPSGTGSPGDGTTHHRRSRRRSGRRSTVPSLSRGRVPPWSRAAPRPWPPCELPAGHVRSVLPGAAGGVRLLRHALASLARAASRSRVRGCGHPRHASPVGGSRRRRGVATTAGRGSGRGRTGGRTAHDARAGERHSCPASRTPCRVGCSRTTGASGRERPRRAVTTPFVSGRPSRSSDDRSRWPVRSSSRRRSRWSRPASDAGGSFP